MLGPLIGVCSRGAKLLLPNDLSPCKFRVFQIDHGLRYCSRRQTLGLELLFDAAIAQFGGAVIEDRLQDPGFVNETFGLELV